MISLFESSNSSGVDDTSSTNDPNREGGGELRKIPPNNFPLKKRVRCRMLEKPVEALESKEKLSTNDEKTTTKNDMRENRVQHDYHDYAEDLPPAGYASIPRADRDVTFCTKLLFLLDSVDEDGYGHVISWQPHGRCFLVRNPDQIVSVLSMYLEITKWTSFQRQMYIYGFKRITRPGSDRGGYYHPKFLRGRTFLAAQINRMTIKGTKVRQKTNPEQEPDFWDMPFVRPLPEDAAVAAVASQQSSLLKMKRRILFRKKARKLDQERQEEAENEASHHEPEQETAEQLMPAPGTSRLQSPLHSCPAPQEQQQQRLMEKEEKKSTFDTPIARNPAASLPVEPQTFQSPSSFPARMPIQYQLQPDRTNEIKLGASGRGEVCMNELPLGVSGRGKYETLLRAPSSAMTRLTPTRTFLQGPERAVPEPSTFFIEAPRVQAQPAQMITPTSSAVMMERPQEYRLAFEQERLRCGMLLVDMGLAGDSRVVGYSTNYVPVGTPVLLVPPDHPMCAGLVDKRTPVVLEVPTTTTESGATAYVFQAPSAATTNGTPTSFVRPLPEPTSRGIMNQTTPMPNPMPMQQHQHQQFVVSRTMQDQSELNRSNYIFPQEQQQRNATSGVPQADRSNYLSPQEQQPQRFVERTMTQLPCTGRQVPSGIKTESGIDDLLKGISNVRGGQNKRTYEESQQHLYYQGPDAVRPAPRARPDTSASPAFDRVREQQQTLSRRLPLPTAVQPEKPQTPKTVPQQWQVKPEFSEDRSARSHNTPPPDLSSSERTAPVANHRPIEEIPAARRSSVNSSFQDPDQIATKQQVMGALEGLMMLGTN